LISRVWEISSGIDPLLPIGWRIVQILRQRHWKTTNTAPATLRAKPVHRIKAVSGKGLEKGKNDIDMSPG
jgi:hypothetical protein